MGNIPVKYLVYGAVAAFAVCFIIFIWSLLLCIFKTKSLKFDGKKDAVIVSVCCVVVALASWVLNIGCFVNYACAAYLRCYVLYH